MMSSDIEINLSLAPFLNDFEDLLSVGFVYYFIICYDSEYFNIAAYVHVCLCSLLARS